MDTGIPLLSHYTLSALDGTCLAPGWAPPRKGQRQQERRPPGGLSQCVLSCLFYALLSRMRGEMNRVVAVSGRGLGVGEGG